MIVRAGNADIMWNVSIDLRLFVGDQHDQAAWFLAIDDESHGPLQSFAVGSTAGCMTMRHKRKDTQAGDAWLGVIQRWKGTVRLLLRGQEGEPTIDRMVDALPFLGR